MKKHIAPIVAAALLLLLVMYVGSYLALVVPGGIEDASKRQETNIEFAIASHYRIGGDCSEQLYRPQARIDQKLRPGEWRWNNRI